MIQFLQLNIKGVLCCLLMYLTFNVQAQVQLSEGTDTRQLNKLSRKFKEKQEAAYRQFHRLVKDTATDQRSARFMSNSLILGLEGIDLQGRPIYNEINSNVGAANTTRASALWTGGQLGLDLNGEGLTFGVWEAFDLTSTGAEVAAVLPSHQELAGRVTIKDGAVLPDGFGADHGTHVAGTLAAAGIVGNAKGMASAALIDSYDVNSDEAEMATAAAEGLTLSQHSYGFTASALDTTLRGAYAINASEWDQIANAAPNYFIGKSAGNAGSTVSNRTFPTGFNILTGSSTSKNVMVVANAAIVNNYTGPESVVIRPSSSRGPTDDGRIKPDITGAGINIYSSTGVSDASYAFLSGTSMSGPNVTGTAGLLQQYWNQLFTDQPLRSATLRGLIIHTADEAGPEPGPDYTFGWGLMNAARAANLLTSVKDETTNPKHLIEQRTRTEGEEDYTLDVVASGTESLRVTIVWNDPAGPSKGNFTDLPTSDDFTPDLINDLDVRIIDNTSGEAVTFMPWVMPFQLDPDSNRDNLATQAATRGDNTRDNVEQILIPNAVPGRTYTIIVNHKGILAQPQEYTIIISGIGGTALTPSGALETGGARIDAFSFGELNSTSADECATYRDFTKSDENPAGVAAGQMVSLSVTLGTCDTDADKHVRVYADWNGDGDFEDDDELLASSTAPVNGTGLATLDNGEVLIPNLVREGQLVLIRAITVETTDVTSIAPTGNYDRGETQDFLVSILAPLTDVGIERIFPPQSNVCVGATVPLVVRVRNFGSADVSDVPIVIEVNDTEVFTVAQPDVISAGNFLDVLVGDITVPDGTEFSIDARTDLSSDVLVDNNAVASVTVPVLEASVLNAANAFSCGAVQPTDLLSLTAETGNTRDVVGWYDAPMAGNLLALGNNTTITKAEADALPTTNTIYVGLNEFEVTNVGPATRNTLGNSFNNNQDVGMVVEALTPFILKSARLYVVPTEDTPNGGESAPVGTTVGSITYTLINEEGTIVSEVNVPLSVSPEEGAQYDIGLPFPEEGIYTIVPQFNHLGAAPTFNLAINFTPGANLYPVNWGDIARALQSQFASPDNFSVYHWFYDLTLTAQGCVSDMRQAVTIQPSVIQTASIEAAATIVCEGQTTTLSAQETDANLKYQWQRRSGEEAFTDIEGATSANFEAGRVADNALFEDEIIDYRVVIEREDDGCDAISDTVTIAVLPVIANVSVVANRSPVFCEEETVSLTLSAITGVSPALLLYTWSRDGTVIATEEGPVLTVTELGDYTVTVGRIDGNCEIVSASNTVQVTNINPVVETSDVDACPDATVTLNVNTNVGDIFWYDAATEGNFLGTGTMLNLATTTEEQMVYAAVNDFTGTLDAPNLNEGVTPFAFTGGRMYFDAEVPFVLEKATIRVQTAGTMTVVIVDKDSSNATIALQTIDVTPDVSEYTLDLFVPYAGEDFGIQVVAFGEGASAILHNQIGSVSFPYEIEGVVSITGNNLDDQTAFYFYLYNWQVSAAGCATDERQAVTIKPAEPATAILSGEGQINPDNPQVSLSVELTGAAPWSITYTRDGGNSTVIEDIATSPHTFNVSEAGSYALATVTDANSCENGTVSGSAEVTAGVVTSLAEGSSQGFTVYPNPSSKQVGVSMPSRLFGQEVTIRMMSSTGAIVGTYQTSNASLSLDVSKLPKGMYLLLIAVGEEEYQQRLIVN